MLISPAKSAVLISWVCSLAFLQGLSEYADAGTFSAGKVLRRFAAPLRSHPILQTNARPCGIGTPNCFFTIAEPSPGSAISHFDVWPTPSDQSWIVLLQVRTRHAGPFAHHWLETETSAGKVTIGFGPATVPFIDAGQVSVEDVWGNTERITGIPPLPLLGWPPLNYRYARPPGDGRVFGKPMRLTLAESEALLQRITHSKFVGPYFPLFHDCRTFVCAAQAAAKRKSALPCYLLFKGYW